MATYLQLREDISDELADNGAITVDQIKKAVTRSIAHYTRKPWWFTETEITFPTVAGQEYYDTGSIPNILEIQSVVLDGLSPLREASPAEISLHQLTPTRGQPTRYSVFGGKFRLFPIPDNVYTVDILCNAQLPELSVDLDSNAWTTTAEELIRQAAKYRLAADIMQADDVATRAKSMEIQAYDELLAEQRRRRPQKHLRTDVSMISYARDVITGQ